MKLGQILLRQRRIDRDQLREALRRQRRSGQALGEILVAMGIVAREDIIAALLRQPTASADETVLARVRPEVARRLPRETAEKHRCLLLVSRTRWACVAMEDPLDEDAMEAIQAELKVPVVAVAARTGPLAAARRQVYADSERVAG